VPLREGEQHRGKLRSDKYQPPVARLLENYDSVSSVEADEDSDPEVGGDDGTGPKASTAVKSRRKTRATTAKQSVSTTAAKVTAVKTAEKKKRKRKTSPPPAVETPVIPTPLIREVDFDDEKKMKPPMSHW
jgi:hypothetical protein